MNLDRQICFCLERVKLLGETTAVYAYSETCGYTSYADKGARLFVHQMTKELLLIFS
jgi:hypothetical protein